MEISDDGRERTRRCPRCHPLAVERAANDVAESVTNAESVANDVAERAVSVAEVAEVAETTEVASNDVAERAVSVAESVNVAEVAESVNVAEVIADLRSVLAAIQRQQRRREPRAATQSALRRAQTREQQAGRGKPLEAEVASTALSDAR